MAQAEHDPMASCYLVTCDAGLPGRVLDAAETLVSQSPREEITRASLDERGVIVVCDTPAAAVDAINVIAPEHLELHCADALGLLGRVRNAGAIFVGPWSSEPLGDYVAGPNHTLPTGGTARWANPLGVYDFQKRSSVICYTPEGLLADAPATRRLPRPRASGRTRSPWACAAASPRAAPSTRRTSPASPGPRTSPPPRPCRFPPAGGSPRRAGRRREMGEKNRDVAARLRPALAGFEPYDPAFSPCRVNLSANENTTSCRTRCAPPSTPPFSPRRSTATRTRWQTP